MDKEEDERGGRICQLHVAWFTWIMMPQLWDFLQKTSKHSCEEFEILYLSVRGTERQLVKLIL